MKRIWIENQGVSPVIATILMVAITVVLAAVLYVMVIEIEPPDLSDGGGSIQNVDVKNSSTAEIFFGSFTGTPSPTTVKLILEDIAGTRISFSWSEAPTSENFDMTSSDPAVSAVYRDFLPVGNEINPGDSILVNGLSSGERYTIKIVSIEGAELSLGGDTEFTTP